jgi:hypothetical protein
MVEVVPTATQACAEKSGSHTLDLCPGVEAHVE